MISMIEVFFLETGYALEIDVRVMIYMGQFSILQQYCVLISVYLFSKFCNSSQYKDWNLFGHALFIAL